MKRHPFDSLSAFFGMLIGGSALAVTLVDERIFDLSNRSVWPLMMIVTGFVLLAPSLGRSRSDDE